MEYLDYIDMEEDVRNFRERIVRDRLNPVTFYDDEDFLSRFRFTKETVLQIVDMIHDPLERRGYKDIYIPPLIQTLITLRFFAALTFLKVIGDTFGVDISTVSRAIRDVSLSIAQNRARFIKFPTGDYLRHTQREFMTLGQLPGIAGAIDCTHIPIQSPGNAQAELFRNRKGYFSINVQAVCDSDHKFTNIVARWPGSTHDSRIFENSAIAAKLSSGEYQGVLLGDNGYPLRPYLLTPVLRPTSRAAQRYNGHLSPIRVRIENLFGIWKRRFPCLRYQMRLKLKTTLVCIVACAVLHNIARNHGDPIPDEEVNHRHIMQDVQAVPVNRNEGGQALRNMMIRRFQ